MPDVSQRHSQPPRPRCVRAAVLVAAVPLAAVLAAAITAGAGTAAAQDARHFSPTYAASEGSPYSSVYARTFGAGGPPPAAPAAPLITSAAPSTPVSPAAPPGRGPEDGAVSAPGNDVVYVIEGGRLLTYRAADYARGRGAVAGAAIPPAVTGSAGAAPATELSGIAGRLYRPSPPAPLATGAGPGGPIRLIPPSGQPGN
ncbi:hypothetical protein AAFN88_09445 [Pelagibius sp. CAU 1746]|uniref:hypothetical protein n=1 Tax=Pelagibius sp. CAU 1746 TaxID=3140370 RepID=UPI00325C1619